jgi:hypothetical protein
VPFDVSRSFHSVPCVFPSVPTGTLRGHIGAPPVIPSTETPKKVEGRARAEIAEAGAWLVQSTPKESRKTTKIGKHVASFNRLLRLLDDIW